VLFYVHLTGSRSPEKAKAAIRRAQGCQQQQRRRAA